jgi:hypothetical protein
MRDKNDARVCGGGACGGMLGGAGTHLSGSCKASIRAQQCQTVRHKDMMRHAYTGTTWHVKHWRTHRLGHVRELLNDVVVRACPRVDLQATGLRVDVEVRIRKRPSLSSSARPAPTRPHIHVHTHLGTQARTHSHTHAHIPTHLRELLDEPLPAVFVG